MRKRIESVIMGVKFRWMLAGRSAPSLLAALKARPAPVPATRLFLSRGGCGLNNEQTSILSFLEKLGR